MGLATKLAKQAQAGSELGWEISKKHPAAAGSAADDSVGGVLPSGFVLDQWPSMAQEGAVLLKVPSFK